MNGPKPNYWRAPTDNDIGNGMDKRCSVWKKAGQSLDVDLVNVEQVGKDEISIEVKKTLDEVKGTQIMNYRIFGNGDIVVNSRFEPHRPHPRKREYFTGMHEDRAIRFIEREPILVEVPSIKSKDLEAYTIQAVVKPEKFSAKNAVWENEAWAPGKLHFEFRNGKLRYYQYGTDYVNFIYPFVPGRSYEILLSYNAPQKNITLYVDGALIETKKLGEAAPLSVSGKSFIGGYSTENRFFIGEISKFRLWNKNLVPADLESQNWEENELLLYYEFELADNLVIKDLAGNYSATIIEKEIEQPELPRFGTILNIPGQFDKVSWYGRGPHENYQDRFTSAYTGLYQSEVEDLYFPYIRPQENGYRTETRWIALQNENGAGIMFVGEPMISFSALNYTMDDFDQGTKKNYRHTNDLVKKDFVSLNIDYKQTGVGGDDSWWARPHPQYTLKYGYYEYSYIIRPIRRSTDLMDLSKKRFK